MASVSAIGAGYYAFDTEGVTIDKNLTKDIDLAFKRAARIPAEQLKIIPAETPVTETKRPATQRNIITRE